MDGHMFDRAITFLLMLGVGVGVALCGLAWGVIYVARHLSVAWVW